MSEPAGTPGARLAGGLALVAAANAVLYAGLHCAAAAALKVWTGVALDETTAMLFWLVLSWKFAFLVFFLPLLLLAWQGRGLAARLLGGEGWLLWLARGSLLATAAAFLLGAAQPLLSQKRSPTAPRNRFGFYALAPNQDSVERRSWNPAMPPMHVVTNSLGYRDREWDLRAPLKRALLVGDSFVWGVGIREQEGTLGACIADELDRGSRRRSWQVLAVAAMPSGLPYYIAAAQAVSREVALDAVIISYLGRVDDNLLDEQLLMSRQPMEVRLLLERFGLVQDLMEYNAGSAGRALERWLLRDWEQARLRARFSGLLDSLSGRRIPLIVWEHGARDPLLDPFRGRPGLTFLDWWAKGRKPRPGVSYPRPLDGWALEPGFAVPDDGHPTELANREFAKDISAAVRNAVLGNRPAAPQRPARQNLRPQVQTDGPG